MVNYQESKIYKLWSDQSDLLYIGSTTQPLARRLSSHLSGIKREDSKTYIDMKTHTNIRIELIEYYPCNTKEELLAREGFFIRQFRSQILNYLIAGRTRKEYEAEYRKNNQQEINKYKRNYRQKNREEINRKQREALQKKKLTNTNPRPHQLTRCRPTAETSSWSTSVQA